MVGGCSFCRTWHSTAAALKPVFARLCTVFRTLKASGPVVLGPTCMHACGMRRAWSWSTKCIHGLRGPFEHGAVVPPISLSTTFEFPAPATPPALEAACSLGVGFDYSRAGNPTRGHLELALAALEGCEPPAVTFASGLAAISALMSAVLLDCSPRRRVVCGDDLYGGTQREFRSIFQPAHKIDLSFVDLSEPDGVGVLSTALADLVFLESPTNPMLKISDIRRIADIAHTANPKCIVAVDNTFLSPLYCSPFEFGADAVVYSCTKNLNGHSDVVMGAVMTRSEEFREKLVLMQKGLGAVPGPFDCYLALRGLKTLGLRLERMEANARRVAEFLEQHERVLSVCYPGLPAHPQHELAKRQQRGFGSVLTFVPSGGAVAAERFAKRTELFAFAVSLGAVESLVELPASMTHGNLDEATRRSLGIDDELVRLSVGIEDVEDLLSDIDIALAP